MEHAVDITRAYVHERKAFGKTLFDFQTISFRLAELATEAHIARVFVDDCLVKLAENRLDNVTTSMLSADAANARSRQTIEACRQMFGGYGYIEETEIARMCTDTRIQKIYGGANEIMKLLIARSL